MPARFCLGHTQDGAWHATQDTDAVVSVTSACKEEPCGQNRALPARHWRAPAQQVSTNLPVTRQTNRHTHLQRAAFKL
jgi:hypothetical protein